MNADNHINTVKIFYFFSILFWIILVLFMIFDRDKFMLAFAGYCQKQTIGLFFKYYTALGGTWIFLPFILFIYYKKNKLLLKVLAYLGILFVFIIILKYGFDKLRPFAYYEQQGIVINQISGVRKLLKHSFPSGHTANAFAFAFLSVYFFPKKSIAVLVSLYAIGIGISRICLFQHFFADVLAGSIIAVSLGFIIFELTGDKNENTGKNL